MLGQILLKSKAALLIPSSIIPAAATMRADAMFAGSTNASILTRRALNSDRKCRAARSPRFLGSETEVDPHMASG